MQELLNQYHQAKLNKYLTRMDVRGAQIAAQFALEDMISDVKKRVAIYGNDEAAMKVLRMEIEDAQ